MRNNGALNVAYAVRRNRRYGGRAGFADGGAPGEEDSFDAPLFLQSGVADVPTPAEERPASRPYRAGLPMGSPRNQPSALQTDLENARYLRDNPAEVFAPLGVTGGVISSAMTNAGDRAGERGMLPMGSPRRPAPRPEESSRAPLLAGVGNIFDMLGPSAAHGAEAMDDPRPVAPMVDPSEKEAAEIARINGLITGKRQELDAATKLRVATDKNGVPIPTSAAKKDSAIKAAQTAITAYQTDLARVEGPESALGMRRADAAKLYNDAVRRWEERQEKLASGKVHSLLPYAQKYPERQAWLQENMPTISGVTGGALGLLGKGKVLKPFLGSVAAGGAEGAMTAAWPTLQDAEFLPPGQTWGQAAERLYGGDPDFLKRVGASAATHAGLAGGASLVGAKARSLMGQVGEGADKFRAWMKKPPPEPSTPPPPAGGPAAASPVTPPVPAPRPKTPPQIYHLPDGTQLKKYDFGSGGSRWMKDGKFIKASDAEALRGGSSMPSTAVHAPPSQARGGGIRSPAMNVAYAVRRQHRAEGGAVHAGPIMSAVPGRTDNHPMDVAEGAYVVPAETVSHLGENNTAAGMEVLNSMFGPESEIGGGASGGETNPVPINAAGGEFVIPPEVVSTIGGGDIKRGHEILDQWVMGRRKEHIKALRGLPGPAKS